MCIFIHARQIKKYIQIWRLLVNKHSTDNNSRLHLSICWHIPSDHPEEGEADSEEERGMELELTNHVDLVLNSKC